MSQSKIESFLQCVDAEGPFLAQSVLRKAFPQDLPRVQSATMRRLRSAYLEWRVELERNPADIAVVQRNWVDLVCGELLEWKSPRFAEAPADDAALSVRAEETGAILRPDAVLRDDNGSLRCLVIRCRIGQDPTDSIPGDVWKASPAERLAILCRGLDVRIGLATDGQSWVLINAPAIGVSSVVEWRDYIWFTDPASIDGFAALMGIRRWLGDSEQSLERLFETSALAKDEVATTLGRQVLAALEVLVHAIDRIDQDRDRKLLAGVPDRQVYEAGLTVLMRLVTLLCAEARGLLPTDAEAYRRHYGVLALRENLLESPDEILETRHEAWSRLIALSRLIWTGSDHPDLPVPALGGSIFDPDRYPLLEGRPKGTSWCDTSADPLPIDDRSVLLMLDALLVLRQPGGARLLSYRDLDVEQIGHIYEGLLEYTVDRVGEPLVILEASKAKGRPPATIAELESLGLNRPRLVDWLKERTGRSESALRNALEKPVAEDRLRRVCGQDRALINRIMPFSGLILADARGDLRVHRGGSVVVTGGSDRRATGAHYTPRDMAARTVATTLEPLAYHGPAEGLPRDQWQVRPSAELLSLKICDPAMGSGAFLVQVCRWLADRLIESWAKAETVGQKITVDGEVLVNLDGAESMPVESEERGIIARRLVAERCCYGVDINPLAVELAKLSLWLATMAKGRPFGFLDHNLRSGDSLLGVTSVKQLVSLHLQPADNANPSIWTDAIEQAVNRATELRSRLREKPIRDVRDVQAMAELERQAETEVAACHLIADALVGCFLARGRKPKELAGALSELGVACSHVFDQVVDRCRSGQDFLRRKVTEYLAADLPSGTANRQPFHWALIFPEVFSGSRIGFDCIVGNPPFLGGKGLSGVYGTCYRDFLVNQIAKGSRGSADLVAYFFLRSWEILADGGGMGLLATKTIAEGDTRQVGIERLVDSGAVIRAAWPHESWPGDAAVETSAVHFAKGGWVTKRLLSGLAVDHISSFLTSEEESSPVRISANKSMAFIGSYVLGIGFTLSEAEAHSLVQLDPKNSEVLFPYLNAQDLTSSFRQVASRWIVNFFDWNDDKARAYKKVFEIVDKHVRPERQRLDAKGNFILRNPLPQRWWQYADKRPALYHAIGRGAPFVRHPAKFDVDMRPLGKVIVVPLHSKYLIVHKCDNNHIFSHALAVFASESDALFAFLSSGLHSAWVWKQASTLESRLRYTPSDCFDTMPLPEGITTDAHLHELGRELNKRRNAAMEARHIGLTAFYNLFHNPDEQADDLRAVRDTIDVIDASVLNAYGWSDLAVGCGFHEVERLTTNDNIRYTLPAPIRASIVQRLAALNLAITGGARVDSEPSLGESEDE
jgi:hypothetical protein